MANWVSLSTQVASAVGTLGVVIFALWFQVIREARQKPRLTLTFDQDQDPLSYAPVVLKDHTELWLRFHVANQRGRRIAREVEVILMGVRAASGESLPDVVPTRTLKWSDVSTNKADVPPGVWKRIDIAHITYRPAVCDSALYLALFPPFDDWKRATMGPQFDDMGREIIEHEAPRARHQLPPGCHELTLAVVASNADAAFYKATIRYSDDEARSVDELHQRLVVDSLVPMKALS